MTTENSGAASIQSLGGQARAAALSPEARSAIAKNAAIERWSPDGGSVWKHGKILVQAPYPLSPADWQKLRAYVEILRPDSPIPCGSYSDGPTPATP